MIKEVQGVGLLALKMALDRTFKIPMYVILQTKGKNSRFIYLVSFLRGHLALLHMQISRTVGNQPPLRESRLWRVICVKLFACSFHLICPLENCFTI